MGGDSASEPVGAAASESAVGWVSWPVMGLVVALAVLRDRSGGVVLP